MSFRGRVIVYSITGCPHCIKAKHTLQEHGIPFNDVNLEHYPQCRTEVKERTGKTTVPQIFFNDTYVGGNSELQTLVQDKQKLQKLIDDLRLNEAPADAPQLPDPDSSTVTQLTSNLFVCEPDEYSVLVRDLKKSGLIKNHRSGLRTVKNSFAGKDFVDWVVKTKGLPRDVAVEMGQSLLDAHFGHNVKAEQVFKDDGTYYRLLEDDESNALNSGSISDCRAASVNEVGEKLRKLILQIYSTFLSADGRSVNYDGIRKSSDFEFYKRATHELTRLAIQNATRTEKLAFFINVYNALVIHANVVRGPPTSLWQRYKFFNTVCYVIGGHTYSLQDIENGVLRANRKGVGMFTRPFGADDPRLSVALDKCEPLVHFALVCGAKSCPPIKTYSAQNVMSELQLAAEAFLESDDALHVDVTSRCVHLSQIFKWYQEDFGNDQKQVLNFLCGLMSNGDKKLQLQQLLNGQGRIKVKYMTYNWAINS